MTTLNVVCRVQVAAIGGRLLNRGANTLLDVRDADRAALEAEVEDASPEQLTAVETRLATRRAEARAGLKGVSLEYGTAFREVLGREQRMLVSVEEPEE